ncbi:hypothetical protein RB595_007346 [Gaeumannomyces hyphopodioides]
MKDLVPVLYPNGVVAASVTEYSDAKSSGLSEVLVKYHEKILQRPDSYYTISLYQAKTLTFLARSIEAKRALEIGVYMGFSAMVWANAVGPGGKVTGLEYDADFAEEARRGVKENGFDNIEIIVGDAATTLPSLEVTEPYDIIFIDADKVGYSKYLDAILARSQPGSASRLLRPGGLIVADNVLRRGLVAHSGPENPNGAGVDAAIIKCLDDFNTALATHGRLEALLLPLFDGLGLARLVD